MNYIFDNNADKNEYFDILSSGHNPDCLNI